MLTHAYADAPNECCGVLLGRGEVVDVVISCRNVHETPRIRYTMHAEDLFRVDRLQNERGWDLVGIYHSHPVTEPEPSATDRALAAYPDARYVIISLRDPARAEVRAWRIRVEPSDGQGKPVTEEDVVIT
jgi:[CysO sulfur-carrier protein]-S-L-cysteine hydrolase